MTLGTVYMLGDDTWQGNTCQVVTLGMVFMSGGDTWHALHVRW